MFREMISEKNEDVDTGKHPRLGVKDIDVSGQVDLSSVSRSVC